MRRLVDWLKAQTRLLIGVSVSGFCIWLFQGSVNPAELAEQFGKADPLLLTVCLATVAISMALKAIRWRLLFPGEAELTFRPLIAALYIGYLANTVAPGRVGEFIRAFLVGRRTRASWSTALATIAIEKLLDLGTLAMMLVGLLMLAPPPSAITQSGWVDTLARSAGLALLAGTLLLGAMLCARGRVQVIVEYAEARLPMLGRLGLSGLSHSFLDGLAAITRPAILPPVLFCTAAVWLMALITIYTGLLGAGVAVPPSASVLVLVVTNIGMAVPSAPGYIGVFEGLFVVALEPYGVPTEAALSAALIAHALIFGSFIVGGFWFLWRDGLSLRQLERESHAVTHAGEPSSRDGQTRMDPTRMDPLPGEESHASVGEREE